MLNKHAMTLMERANYERYVNRLSERIAEIPWTWFISLNSHSTDINTVHTHLTHYIKSIGGVIGHRYRYCLAICEHESVHTSSGVTPLHVHGFIQCPDHITGESLRNAWLDRRSISSYVPTSEKRNTLIGRTEVERFDPTKKGIRYTVDQSIGVILTNVAAIKSIL